MGRGKNPGSGKKIIPDPGSGSRILGVKKHRIPDPDPQHCYNFKRPKLLCVDTSIVKTDIF
jgi:hypothetical protein